MKGNFKTQSSGWKQLRLKLERDKTQACVREVNAGETVLLLILNENNLQTFQLKASGLNQTEAKAKANIGSLN